MIFDVHCMYRTSCNGFQWHLLLLWLWRTIFWMQCSCCGCMCMWHIANTKITHKIIFVWCDILCCLFISGSARVSDTWHSFAFANLSIVDSIIQRWMQFLTFFSRAHTQTHINFRRIYMQLYVERRWQRRWLWWRQKFLMFQQSLYHNIMQSECFFSLECRKIFKYFCLNNWNRCGSTNYRNLNALRQRFGIHSPGKKISLR